MGTARKDVVLVGAGHAHVGVLRNFGMAPMPGVRLTLITRQVDTPYSGMLPGLIAGHYTRDQAHIDTGPLCRFAGARLFNSEVIGLDLAGRRVLCDNRPPVPFDVLSINIGSTPATAQVEGAAAHSIPVKPIDGFLVRFEAARDRILAAGGRARIGVVGAGPGGVELLLALHHRLTRDVAAAGGDPAGLSFTILTPTAEILPAMPPRVRRRFTQILGERGITIEARAPVARVDAGAALLDDGRTIPLDEIFWTTRAAAAPWLASTGLAVDKDGFMRVDDRLQSVSLAGIFAAGDIAAVEGHALPKSGVYAVRAGPLLSANIRRSIDQQPLERWRPQREALYLLSTGGRHAIGTRNGIMVEGDWVWRWKDWIDRRFMDRFNTLPAMPDQAMTAGDETMRCGGCGAKVGASVLRRALGGIVPLDRTDVLIGLAAADDAAVVDNGGPQLGVQTVDYFRAFVDDPFQFGRIAANHALGDIFAMGAAPQSALAIATLPHGPSDKVEADLSMMMAGANEVLREAGCALVGGHTSEGAELALGFAVNGLVERHRLLRKQGLEVGDALILTKPLGTGTLLAADMRGKAKARWIVAALAQMVQSNRSAAAILEAHGAHAMTDVTGFGLVGHLFEMLGEATTDVTLALDAIPRLEGAQETLAAGLVSSLHEQNLGLRARLGRLPAGTTETDIALLFDPQTAGGLLAAVPAARAAACVKALAAKGYGGAAIIGAVGARTSAPERVKIVRQATALPLAAAAPLPVN